MNGSASERIAAFVKAAYPSIVIEGYEESLSTSTVRKVAEELEYEVMTFSIAAGLRMDDSDEVLEKDVVKALAHCLQYTKVCVMLLDFHRLWGDTRVCRAFKEALQIAKSKKITFFAIVTPNADTPEELRGLLATVNMPLPDDGQRQYLVSTFLQVNEIDIEPPEASAIATALGGLTAEECENLLATLAISDRMTADAVYTEKMTRINTGSLSVEKPVPPERIGGLGNLKEWLKLRSSAFSEEAREWGLPAPKGVLLTGVPGCGKSLTAKAVGTIMKIPVLRLDVGSLFGRYVGQSEAQARRAIETASAFSPCVLWIDEVEKGLGNSTGGETDSGTSSRVFSTILTWMQEKTDAVFVVATCNDIFKLPPEFTRLGRFDQVFWVDTPSEEERQDILRIHIESRGHEVPDIKEVASTTPEYSGAELEAVVIEALFKAFTDKTPLAAEHIKEAARDVVPLAVMRKEEIEKMREWAGMRARPASTSRKEEQITPTLGGRKL